MEIIKGLEWRYATKKFDSTKEINSEDWDKLKKAIQLSASSYGLQLYKVLIIKDIKTREKLLPAAYNQPQIIDSAAVVVFCNYTKVENSDIDEYIELVAKTRNQSIENLKGYADYMKNTIGTFSEEQKNIWTAKQTYIALANLLAAAGELKIDACPMEGFSSGDFNQILGLNEQNLNAAVIATIGYRSKEDQLAIASKVRKPEEKLFEEI